MKSIRIAGLFMVARISFMSFIHIPEGSSFDDQSLPSKILGIDCHDSVFDNGPTTPISGSVTVWRHILFNQSNETMVSLFSSTTQAVVVAFRAWFAAKVYPKAHSFRISTAPCSCEKFSKYNFVSSPLPSSIKMKSYDPSVEAITDSKHRLTSSSALWTQIIISI